MEEAIQLDKCDEQECYAHLFTIPTNKDIGAQNAPPAAGKPDLPHLS